MTPETPVTPEAPETPETKILTLDQIRIDGGTQPRVLIDQDLVKEYAELYGTGTDLAPVVVFFDGASYWLADGFHRYWANRKIECDYVHAEIHPGTQRDAILYSVGANAAHGLRRTSADKRKAVLTVLTDEEWSRWTDREIARRCSVDHKTVGAARQSLTGEIPQSEPPSRTYKTRHGTIAEMNTAKIGRAKKKRKFGGISPDAHMPVRQPRPALAQTHLNLPHDPVDGARAIAFAMGAEYARQLIEALTSYLQNPQEGEE